MTVMATLRAISTVTSRTVGDSGLLELIWTIFEDFAFSRFNHINTPATEFGSEAGILTIFPDGERELALGDGDDCGMVDFAQLYFERFYRTKRVGHKGSRVSTPLDNVYLLVIEFVYDAVSYTHLTLPTNRE